MNSQKEGNICLALILFMLHLAARATAKFLTILPGYLHLNRFSWHYVNLLVELKFSFSLGSCPRWFALSPPCSPPSAPLGYISTTWSYLWKRSSQRVCLELGQRWRYADFSDLHNKITSQMNSCLGLKESIRFGPTLPTFRGVLIRPYFQSDYSVVFSLLSI